MRTRTLYERNECDALRRLPTQVINIFPTRYRVPPQKPQKPQKPQNRLPFFERHLKAPTDISPAQPRVFNSRITSFKQPEVVILAPRIQSSDRHLGKVHYTTIRYTTKKHRPTVDPSTHPKLKKTISHHLFSLGRGTAKRYQNTKERPTGKWC